MVHETLAATDAVVTLDVGLPGIIWGWIITMNMWAKSIWYWYYLYSFLST